MEPKPKHLESRYAKQFQDESIVNAYRYRPPYSVELFGILADLVRGKPRIALDVGCGTGHIARHLAPYMERVDAVDFSQHMIAQGKKLPGGATQNLHWIFGPIETVPLSPPYSLITAGQSLHWLEWEIVFPRFHRLLTPGSFLAIIGNVYSATSWDEPLGEIISRYSTNKDYRPYNLFAELEKRNLFITKGQIETEPFPFQQTLAAYIESFHSRNGLSRDRLRPEKAQAFEDEVLELVSPYCPENEFEIKITTTVHWGLPTAEVDL